MRRGDTVKLFDIVPGNFFSVLSSANREIYYDALMIIHDMFKFELNIRTDDYLSSIITLLDEKTYVYETEEDDEDTYESGQTLSSKARLILNRLLRTGWIDSEHIDRTFIEIITPRNYAIPVLRMLKELGDTSLQEYNSLVFATFSGLKQAVSENEQHLYEALLSAKSNTEQLQYSLRTLFHSIRSFLRGVALQQDVNVLLEDHFNEYKIMMDRIYHPIKTMDSVHRYIAPIQNLLSNLLANDEQMQVMRERAISIKKYDDESQSNEEIIKAIDYIMDFYQAVGGLVSEIDRKHSTYTKNSIDKIQYLMTADQSIKGKLAETLKFYARASQNTRDNIAEIMEYHINVGRQGFLDELSLYHKNVKSRRILRKALAISNIDDLSGRAEEFLIQRIKRGFPLAKIRAYIKNLIPEGSDEIKASDINISCDADFINTERQS